MKDKINVAEILKDCPKGMDLNCMLFDNVIFDHIGDGGIWITHIDSKSCKHSLYLYNDGSFPIHNLGSLPTKCVIFPKGKTTWEGFVPPCKFKDGDIVVAESDSVIQVFILQEVTSDRQGYCYIGYDFEFNEVFDAGEWVFDRRATEEEKQKLFKAIREKGYKWNPETKTLEELAESKEDVEDLVMSGIYFDRKYYADEVELHLGNYEIEIRDGSTYAIFKNQKTKTFEQPKFKIGDRIKQIGSPRCYIIKTIEFDRYILHNNQFIRFTDEHIYELVPNKFDITTLVPFESKVLVRDNDCDEWRVAFWGYLREKQDIKYDTTRGVFRRCIPYEDNEHLLGKTEDCKEYFKTWLK